MSNKSVTPLHIEWTPTLVRVVDIVLGRSAQASGLSEASDIINGHRQAIVGVGRAHFFLKTVRLPKAASEDLRRILSVQIGELFPLPSTELSFDFYQTSDISAEGCLTVVGAMRSDDLKRIKSDLRQAGLSVERIVPISIAAQSVAAQAGCKNALIAELDFDGIALDVVQDGVIRLSRIIATSSNLTGEVQRTIAATKIDDPVILSGQGVTLHDATPCLDSALSLLHKAPHFNFVLEDERLAAQNIRRTAQLWLAGGSVAAALILAGFTWFTWNANTQQVSASEQKTEKKLDSWNTKLKQQNLQSTSLASAQKSLTLAYEPGQPLSDISQVIGDSVPAGAWITTLNLERGKPMDARGIAKYASQVSQFIDALSASPRFRDVKLIFANSAVIEKTPVVQFEVSAVCAGNTLMPVPSKKQVLKSESSTESSRQGGD